MARSSQRPCPWARQVKKRSFLARGERPGSSDPQFQMDSILSLAVRDLPGVYADNVVVLRLRSRPFLQTDNFAAVTCLAVDMETDEPRTIEDEENEDDAENDAEEMNALVIRLVKQHGIQHLCLKNCFGLFSETMQPLPSLETLLVYDGMMLRDYVATAFPNLRRLAIDYCPLMSLRLPPLLADLVIDHVPEASLFTADELVHVLPAGVRRLGLAVAGCNQRRLMPKLEELQLEHLDFYQWPAHRNIGLRAASLLPLPLTVRSVSRLLVDRMSTFVAMARMNPGVTSWQVWVDGKIDVLEQWLAESDHLEELEFCSNSHTARLYEAIARCPSALRRVAVFLPGELESVAGSVAGSFANVLDAHPGLTAITLPDRYIPDIAAKLGVSAVDTFITRADFASLNADVLLQYVQECPNVRRIDFRLSSYNGDVWPAQTTEALRICAERDNEMRLCTLK